MNIVLHDYNQHLLFAPLTLTRPVGKLRMGMWTNDERWQYYFPEATISFSTEGYLVEKFPIQRSEDTLWVNAAVVPTEKLVQQINVLRAGEALFNEGTFFVYRGNAFQLDTASKIQINEGIVLSHRWDLYLKNAEVIKADFEAYTKGKRSEKLSLSNRLIGDSSQLFIEKGARIEGAILNVEHGPIYIGKEAEIMEGVLVRGSLAMAEHSVLKMGAKIYGGTSIGNACKVGGEVSNSIFQAYSNKGHDGFIGNALIGAWCNLGADTNCSNLKNNYGNVKTYDYSEEELVPTNQQFMGVTMGDFSKTAINTMLNTATVIGVAVNVFTAEFPAKFVPSFVWGGDSHAARYDLTKLFEDANQMMVRRGKELTIEEKAILKYLYRTNKRD